MTFITIFQSLRIYIYNDFRYRISRYSFALAHDDNLVFTNIKRIYMFSSHICNKTFETLKIKTHLFSSVLSEMDYIKHIIHVQIFLDINKR